MSNQIAANDTQIIVVSQIWEAGSISVSQTNQSAPQILRIGCNSQDRWLVPPSSAAFTSCSKANERMFVFDVINNDTDIHNWQIKGQKPNNSAVAFIPFTSDPLMQPKQTDIIVVYTIHMNSSFIVAVDGKQDYPMQIQCGQQ